jgi:hypothetical protein
MLYPGRIIKQGEADPAIVKALAQALAAQGYAVTSPPGAFDAAFASTIKLFQSQHVDDGLRPLQVDGKVGSLTWGALFATAPARPAVAPATGLAASALARANSQIGVMEQPIGSNRGPMVDVFLKSVGVPPGNYWCMAFVNWCFQNGSADAGISNTFPKTAGCIDAWNRVKADMPRRIVTRAAAMADPSLVKPGFVFILDHGGGNGHTGFVSHQSGGALATIEGNSNATGSANGVGVFALNRRGVMEKDLKGFLDFTT